MSNESFLQENKDAVNKASTKLSMQSSKSHVFKDGDGSDMYNVQGVNIANSKSHKAAIRELKVLQQGCISDYKTWAKADIHYSDFSNTSDKERENILTQRLKSYDDAYTIRMMTGFLTPLSQGVDAKTLLQTYFSYKMTEIMNPSMTADKSRMYLNFRQTLQPMVENNKFLSVIAKPLSDVALDKSVDNMNESISKNLNNNTLDSLVMTPRQLAAIKLNFMEQHYTDMRSLDRSSSDYNEKITNMKTSYDRSMEHIKSIAENSGYEMSAVASEERYLVGLKMMENPNYSNVFQETYSLYGIQPRFPDEQNDMGLWQGDFVSSDEHMYTTEGRTNGSFSVRQPLTESGFVKLKESLDRQGSQYAWMRQYISSDDCPADKDVKKAALEKLSEKYDQYEQRVISLLQDDLGYDKDYAKKVFDNTFTKAYNDEMSVDKKDAFKDKSNPFEKNASLQPGSDFYHELRYTIEKDAYNTIGTDVLTSQNYDESGAAARNKALDSISKKAKKYYEDRGTVDNRDRDTVASDIINNRIEKMNASDLANLMIHVGCNMEQSCQNRGSYDRQQESAALKSRINKITSHNAMYNQDGDNLFKNEQRKIDITVDDNYDDDDYQNNIGDFDGDL